MFSVYSGSGAKDYTVGERCFSDEQWGSFRRGTVQLLRSRGFSTTAELLKSLPFEIREGENFFGDEFVVLYAELPISQYAELVDRYSDPMSRYEFSQMASALKEICPAYIRFIGFGAALDDAVPPVEEPDGIKPVLRDIIKTKQEERVMFVRFDDAPVNGVFSVDGYIDARSNTAKQVANFILTRIAALEQDV